MNMTRRVLLTMVFGVGLCVTCFLAERSVESAEKQRRPKFGPPCTCPVWPMYPENGGWCYYADYFANDCNDFESVFVVGNYDNCPYDCNTAQCPIQGRKVKVDPCLKKPFPYYFDIVNKMPEQFGSATDRLGHVWATLKDGGKVFPLKAFKVKVRPKDLPNAPTTKKPDRVIWIAFQIDQAQDGTVDIEGASKIGKCMFRVDNWLQGKPLIILTAS